MASIDDISPAEWNKITADWREQVKNSSPKSVVLEQEPALFQPIKPFNLPKDAKERKAIPVYTGFINYFPRAIAEVAKISLKGAMMRHILDKDWAQVAWRAMANLEKKLEREEL